MPMRPPRPCVAPSCPALVAKGSRCAKHRRETYRRQDNQRTSFHRRGYGKRWAKVRRQVLNAEPLCRSCAREGHTTAANVVDHIIPKARGAEDYDLDNLQPLCTSCHNRKTMNELNARRRPNR